MSLIAAPARPLGRRGRECLVALERVTSASQATPLLAMAAVLFVPRGTGEADTGLCERGPNT